MSKWSDKFTKEVGKDLIKIYAKLFIESLKKKETKNETKI